MLSAGYERIAIVDFDVHHGNGTQEVSTSLFQNHVNFHDN